MSASKSHLLSQVIESECVFNGDWVPASGLLQWIIEPATGERLMRCATADSADIAKASRDAALAQPGWAALGPRQRAAIFRKAADVAEQSFEELALYVARETGAALFKGQHEVREAIVLLHQAAGLLSQAHGVVLPSEAGRLSYARRQPHGVVGVISPFNFPLVLSMRSVAPALAAGNAVVLKPDPQTPVSGGFLIARLFEVAGLPKGLLQVLPGAADAGEALCRDPNVRMIAFTGSTGAGRKVAEVAGRNLKKVALELGGKNPLIILEDADLDLAARNAAWGAWLHQGQICMATGLILAHESIAEELTRKLVEKARALTVGNAAQGEAALGPLINQRQLKRVHDIVSDSVRAGARLEAGGEHDRLFYQATVLSGVKPGMRAFDEEVFGPVATVVSFATDDEAVELANRTEYGLAAAIISPSVGRAMAIGERLQCGMLHINDQTVADECINPFGGRGASGNGGSVGGPADWDEYTQWQWVTVKDQAPVYPF
ncbi:MULTISPECIES: benzaldehyde dehydrogenase [Pseudomonas]|uniref:Putative aldehyde dehydrogenase n=1 Tax=Pseudomonas brassicacearum (strain NFM421) TaxID=994484 RepID=F2KA43_PSEBN|nr:MULTISPECIES: benzaldehyde dehydrogenase [Pseudomonas]EIK64667.1 benzaldehyde dehydrogenase (NAD(+)) [Pseudomonas fluorescens Q8r1-96]KIR17666.1 Benzaldehyde dehydrogenase [NAD(+)] [Pseudomonas fluorescens]AEA68974.1 putative aldehyde dehydrogenase [Pseudomonas brassicacearum subsp. brassicacearum NFM421]ALQ03513.1 Putative benzaldehyde dehydrogenase oxidoreductase protein [Pseudomonas brassicacearum]AOS37721.1 benzaldehyde dehydrogenase [Pseudomonas brassicacearum]